MKVTGAERGSRLMAVAGLFLKLGAISFGGPAAHIALMEQEVVRKRAWLDREHFLDLLAATNLVPGPNATEMAIHIGYVHAGWPGLIVGGIAFIVPAFVISLALSWVYGRFGALPEAQALFYGINPVVMAIILVATYRLGRTALKDRVSVVLSLMALSAALLGVDEVLILLVAGVASILVTTAPDWWARGASAAWTLPLMPRLGAVETRVVWLDDRLVALGLFFLKVGSVLFGSGMVLFAFIQKDVVARFGWLSQQQLIDAIAVG